MYGITPKNLQNMFDFQRNEDISCKYVNGYGKSTSVSVIENTYQEEEDSKILEPKEELKYLSEALGFQVSYTDFPQKSPLGGQQSTRKSPPEFITLVKLATKPPKVRLFFTTSYRKSQ